MKYVRRGPHALSWEMRIAHVLMALLALLFCFKRIEVFLKTELPYDLAILLLSIYQEKTIIQKEICTLMFIAALFTIARTWKN